MKILITGGCGYIGSHMSTRLLELGYEIVIIDNLSNSYSRVLTKIKEITNKSPKFFEVDIKDKENLNKVFEEGNFDAVIHFAAAKSIGESVKNPLKYYLNNVVGTLNLLDAMKANNVRNLIFSSSAAVYGEAKKIPIKESSSLSPTNPYGSSKLIGEMLIKDFYFSEKDWSILMLRYFNPIGAHKSGIIGEFPRVPYNIIPIISDVALGKSKSVKIFGKDYHTRDGTCIRDYIHIEDLIDGHLVALENIYNSSRIDEYNLGTGQGISILDLIHTFEKVSGLNIPIEFVGKRVGDVPILYTDPSKAKRDLKFSTSRNLTEMCEDTWNWLIKNPQGYLI